MDHVRSRLTQGLALSKAVFRTLDLDDFTWSVLAPADIDRRRLTRLEYGGVGNATESFKRVSAELNSQLEASDQKWLIVEDRLAKREDPILSQQPGAKMFSDDEVYHVVGPSESLDAIRDAIRNGESAQGVVFFVTTQSRESMAAADRLTPSEIESLAVQTELIGVDAFDGESYILGVRT
jgi:hypothetical protein